jgi:hypothetical protein
VTETELAADSPYAVAIREVLELDQVPLVRRELVNHSGTVVVSDSMNRRAGEGLSATIHHNCALFLAERESAEIPTVESPGGTVFLGAVNEQLVSLSFYNPATEVALGVGSTSQDQTPMSIEDLTAVAQRLSEAPAIVDEVGGACR